MDKPQEDPSKYVQQDKDNDKSDTHDTITKSNEKSPEFEERRRKIESNVIAIRENDSGHTKKNIEIVNKAYSDLLHYAIKRWDIFLSFGIFCYVVGYADYTSCVAWGLSVLQNCLHAVLAIGAFLLIGFPTISGIRKATLEIIAKIADKTNKDKDT